MLHARRARGRPRATCQTLPSCSQRRASQRRRLRLGEDAAGMPHQWLGAQSSEPGLPVPETLCLVRHPGHTPGSHRPTDKTLVHLSIRALCCPAVAPSLGILDTGVEPA